MKQDITSPEAGITDGLQVITYVADNGGSQQLVPGSMWQPVNIVNRQAWQEIEKQIEASKAKIAAGKVSCLHYYMTANQMDAGLLAQYTGQSRWRVHLHLIPFFFSRLGANSLKKYVAIFKVSSEDLMAGRLLPPVYNQRELES